MVSHGTPQLSLVQAHSVPPSYICLLDRTKRGLSVWWKLRNFCSTSISDGSINSKTGFYSLFCLKIVFTSGKIWRQQKFLGCVTRTFVLALSYFSLRSFHHFATYIRAVSVSELCAVELTKITNFVWFRSRKRLYGFWKVLCARLVQANIWLNILSLPLSVKNRQKILNCAITVLLT